MKKTTRHKIDKAQKESCRAAVTLLRDRCTEAIKENTKMADVKYGMKTLLESEVVTAALSPGRRGQLEDLKQKLEVSEAEHSPETITTLQQALNAFLDEELAEEVEPEGEKDMATKEEAGADLSAKAAADKYSLYDDEAGDSMEEAKRAEARKEAAEADGFAKYAGAAGVVPKEDEEAKRCGACGHEMDEALDVNATPSLEELAEEEAKREAKKEEEEAKKEEVKRKEGKKKESAKPDALRVLQAEVAQLKRQLKESGMSSGTVLKLTEAERKELAILRTRDRARTLREAAGKAIANADVEGIVEVEDLLPFRESQWQGILRLAKNQTPPRAHGFARTESAPAQKRGPATASEIIDSLRW